MLKRIANVGLICAFLSSPAYALPQRIASGTVGTDEILLELLKGEESRLVAVSLFADDARYSFLTSIPKTVKARVGDNVENLLLLKPDLVFIASYTASTISEQLKAAKVKVHVQKSFGAYKDIQNNIREIGELVGKTREAQALVRAMDEKVEAARKKQETCKTKPTFLQYVSNDFVPGRGTIIDDVGEIAGYHNVLRDIGWKGWTQISQEVLVQQNPDVILASESDAPNKKILLDKLRTSPAWQKLTAVKDGKIIMIPERLLYTVSQHTADLLSYLISVRPCGKIKK